MGKKNRQVFEAVIEEGRGGGALVAVPLDVPALFDTRGQVKVRAWFDAVEYRGSIAPMGGRHILGIRKSIREAIGKSIGDRVRVTLERDDQPRPVDVPKELASVFRAKPNLRKTYQALSYTHRREIAEWVGSAKKAETRERRAQKAIERIRAI